MQLARGGRVETGVVAVRPADVFLIPNGYAV
jgi:hypothetical protein